MDLKLRFLDSFTARGSDGAEHKVMAYERMRHDDSVADALGQHWVSTGVQEWRLDTGELVEPSADGGLLVVRTGMRLTRS